MSVAEDTYVTALEMLLGHSFQYRGLLQAFVHSSVNNHNKACYQRLALLGDAALDYLVTSHLYSAYPEITSGQMTVLRSSVVNNKTFAFIAIGRSFHLCFKCNSTALTEAIDNFSRYSQLPDSERDFHEEPAYPKILVDIFEACIGAILVDAGFNLERGWEITLDLLKPASTLSSLHLNQVRELIELLQCVNLPLRHSKLIKENCCHFTAVEVDVKGEHSTFSAVNSNSKVARRIASHEAVYVLKALGIKCKKRSLQEIVHSTRKEVSKLIGYNEEPILILNIISTVKESSPEPEKTLELLREPKNTSKLSQLQEKSPSKLAIITKNKLSNLPLFWVICI